MLSHISTGLYRASFHVQGTLLHSGHSKKLESRTVQYQIYDKEEAKQVPKEQKKYLSR